MYTKLKTSIEKLEQTHAIYYQLNCDNCGGVYIGQTKKSFKDQTKRA